MLSDLGGAAPLRAAHRYDTLSLSRGSFPIFVVGLAGSVTRSESTLAVLTALWLWRLRDPEVRRDQPWSLGIFIAIFGLATLLSALTSDVPGRSLLAARGTLTAFAFFVTADTLRGTDRVERFLGQLALSGALLGAMGLVQVATCPTPTPTPWPLAWFYARCERARGPFSIYMTLGGILAMLLLVGLPPLLTARRTRRRWVMWLRS